ncbi:MAG: hypothetical protein WBN19_01900 [Lutimonas sp.]
MNHLKNLIKTLLSLLFIVNLYISFDHIISQESLTTDHNIELLLTQKQNDTIDFNQFKQSFSLNKPVVSYEKNQKFDHLINNKNSSEQLKFNIQNNNALSFKPILLQIVINEISILKSHCI